MIRSGLPSVEGEDGLLRLEPRVLRTKRLVLRPFVAADAERFALLAGTQRMADTMVSLPHPLSVDVAQREITRFEEEWEARSAATFAIAWSERASELVGGVAIRHIDYAHKHGELSFWVAELVQREGLGTEAAAAAIDYAFRDLGLNRVCAYHLLRNPISGRVLAKIGMSQEGRLRERVLKWGKYEDVLMWAVLCQDWMKGARNSTREADVGIGNEKGAS